MKDIVDTLIDQMDAVMCGQQDGAVPLPEFDDVTLARLRAVAAPLVIDCRVCERFAAGDKKCAIPSHCVQGDHFKRSEFAPLWRTER